MSVGVGTRCTMYNDAGSAGGTDERIVLQAQKLKGAREAVTEKVSCEIRSRRQLAVVCMRARGPTPPFIPDQPMVPFFSWRSTDVDTMRCGYELCQRRRRYSAELYSVQLQGPVCSQTF